MSATCQFRSAVLALAAANLLAPAPAQAAADLVTSALNGSNGLRLDGLGGSWTGHSVSVLGDVNGDGIDDLLVGALNADNDDPFIDGAGHAYVVFGRSSWFAATLDLTALDGSNGFRLEGVAAFDQAGFSVADAGDLNGDDIADLAVCGAPSAANDCHVVFGRPGAVPFSAVIDLGALDGSDGFRIGGLFTSVAAAGDVNGDGIGDLLIGNSSASPGGRSFAGSVYVLFGDGGGFGADVDVGALDGSNGFRIDGGTAGDRAGGSVAAAGDVNDDGVDDLIIGAWPLGDQAGADQAYVVFGRASTPEDPTPFAATLDLSSLDGSTGFAIGVRDEIESLGAAVAGAGDVDGDGIDDVVVGAPAASPGGTNLAGSAFVVFGRDTAFPATLAPSDLDGSNGFRIDGSNESGALGYSVSGGDVNGDGLADLVLGAPTINSGIGRSVLVFGRSGGFPAMLAESSLDGSNGLRIADNVGLTVFGASVSGGGDFNADGTVDLLIGASLASRAYVVFGNGAPLLAMGADGSLISLEGDSDPFGAPIATLFPDTVYLDTQPLAGAAIDNNAPVSAHGVWQYRSAPLAEWETLPTSGLSPENALLLAVNGALRFLPNDPADFFGAVPGPLLRAWDGADAGFYSFGPGQDIRASIGSLGGFSNDANRLTVSAEVLPVNDPPSFVAASPPEVNEDAGAQSLTGWASEISPGPANEAAQSVSFEVGSITNPGLFSVPPSVSSTGVLSYTLAADANGASGFSVRVIDDGGTADDGVDASANQFFVLSVRAVNDAPSFIASDPPAVDQDAGPQTVIGWASFDPGAGDESGQVASYSISDVSNPGLFAVLPSVAANGDLSFTPAASASGTSSFTVRVSDNGGTAHGGVDTSAPQQFTISVDASVPIDDRVFCSGFEALPCP